MVRDWQNAASMTGETDIGPSPVINPEAEGRKLLFKSVGKFKKPLVS
jgi:hypothetical protein